MSEGGLFAWKIQKIRQKGPAATYSNMSLPKNPPKGQHWVQDLDTREWFLTEITTIPLVQKEQQQDQPQQQDSSSFNPKSLVEDEVVAVILGGENDIVVQEATTEYEMDPGLPTFLEHSIQPTDTFQGICLKYQITPSELRRANGGFSGGTNLNLMPNPLRIPVTPKYLHTRRTSDQHPSEPTSSSSSSFASVADKLKRLQAKCPSLHKTEAKCYLELNDWDIEKALENAKEDGF